MCALIGYFDPPANESAGYDSEYGMDVDPNAPQTGTDRDVCAVLFSKFVQEVCNVAPVL